MGIGLYALRKLFYIVEIDGCSMSPFLLSGDQVLVTRYFPKSLVKRGSVVLFTPWSMALPDQNNIYIKRVVGLPNDTLAIYETELIALKDVLSERYLQFFCINVRTAFPHFSGYPSSSYLSCADQSKVFEEL